jgi:glycerol-1-phosphate dehydrogenase [NAD(P)+]
VNAPPIVDPLEALLGGKWLDPDDGTPLRVPIRAIAIERTLAHTEANRVAALGLGRRLAVVSDRNTHAALAGRIERALAACATVKPVSFDASPHADVATTELLREVCRGVDALVAVGSGTINDLCKYAAALDRKPYIVFATAPSMNGYTSASAAITVDGHKQSLPAAAPRGVFIDLEVLAGAPARMIRAGLGDSLCRSTAQADWLLSHRLLGTPYRSAPFALLAADEAMLFDAPDALFGGDIEAMRALARTLVLSGLGMTLAGGSYPASQGEHLISHYLDMFSPPERGVYLHGEQVGVATLTMARLQQAMLGAAHRGSVPRASTGRSSCAASATRSGVVLGRVHQEASRSGRRGGAGRARRRFVGRDPLGTGGGHRAGRADRARARARRMPATPAAIGVMPEFYARAVRNARFLRDRYTFLDLADDSGRLAALFQQ